MKAACWWIWLACAALASHCFGYEPTTNESRDAAAIINGTPATPNAQPWMVALLRKTANSALTPSQLKFCGGSLISSTWVLTAAHCVNSLAADKLEVMLGRENLDVAGGEVLPVSQIIVNPRYDADRQYGDIALLRLAKPSTATPVALPGVRDAGTFPGLTGAVLGWGSTNGLRTLPCVLRFTDATPMNANDYFCKTFVYRTPGQSKVLLVGAANVLDRTTCNRRFIAALKELDIDTTGITLIADLYPGTLCVADPLKRSATCYGDSGGPLTIQTQGRTVLAGLTSFGIGLSCQGQNQINFYTEVAAWLDFITQTMTSQPELDFDQLCPASMTPVKVEVGAVSEGNATVRLSWDRPASAIGYSLIYMQLPRRDDTVSRADLPVTSNELTISLKSGASYLVSIQPKGDACDGAVSKPAVVNVP